MINHPCELTAHHNKQQINLLQHRHSRFVLNLTPFIILSLHITSCQSVSCISRSSFYIHAFMLLSVVIFLLWLAPNVPLWPSSSLLFTSELFAEARPDLRTLAALPLCVMGRKRWRVPQERAGVCRRPGCWPAKLISHSPGTHNASEVSMGINGRSERERDWTGKGREGENIQGRHRSHLGEGSGYRDQVFVWGFFFHIPHFITCTVTNKISSPAAVQVRTQWTQ